MAVVFGHQTFNVAAVIEHGADRLKVALPGAVHVGTRRTDDLVVFAGVECLTGQHHLGDGADDPLPRGLQDGTIVLDVQAIEEGGLGRGRPLHLAEHVEQGSVGPLLLRRPEHEVLKQVVELHLLVLRKDARHLVDGLHRLVVEEDPCPVALAIEPGIKLSAQEDLMPDDLDRVLDHLFRADQFQVNVLAGLVDPLQVTLDHREREVGVLPQLGRILPGGFDRLDLLGVDGDDSVDRVNPVLVPVPQHRVDVGAQLACPGQILDGKAQLAVVGEPPLPLAVLVGLDLRVADLDRAHPRILRSVSTRAATVRFRRLCSGCLAV